MIEHVISMATSNTGKRQAILISTKAAY